MGFTVNDFLVGHLPTLFDVKFTAGMEQQLDEVEEGRVEWHKMLRDFYGPFQEWVVNAKGPPADPGKVGDLLKLLQDVKQWTPKPEAPAKRRGGRKPAGDEDMVASIREQFEKQEKPISDRQLDALVRMGVRYRDQLPELDATIERLGLQEAATTHARAAEPPSPETLRKLDLLAGVKFDEPRKRGRMVFDDGKFVGSLTDQARGGKGLSDKQLGALDRLFSKYLDQLPNPEALRAELLANYQEFAAPAEPTLAPTVALLDRIREWKPAQEAKGRVWDDKGFADSLRRQFATKKNLSPKQVGALKKMLRKYADQIDGYDAQIEPLGLMPKRAPKA